MQCRKLSVGSMAARAAFSTPPAASFTLPSAVRALDSCTGELGSSRVRPATSSALPKKWRSRGERAHRFFGRRDVPADQRLSPDGEPGRDRGRRILSMTIRITSRRDSSPDRFTFHFADLILTAQAASIVSRSVSPTMLRVTRQRTIARTGEIGAERGVK